MNHHCPISPLTILTKGRKSKPIVADGACDLDEEELDPKSVVVNDPIVGEELITLDENGPGVLTPKAIPAQKEMSTMKRERHFTNGHLPYDPRCEICVRCKRPNAPHLKAHESERAIPLLVGDYGFIKDGVDEENATILVMKLYPYKLMFACRVSGKGSDPLVVARLCRFIMECGLLHFAYRSDREPAIVSLIQDACAMAGRNGVNIQAVEEEAPEPEVERAHVAVPEHSHPGESQSNGLAERTMREVTNEIRTLKMYLELRIKGRLANDHPVMSGMVEHAAYLLNRCKLGTDGRTAYGRLHGKESTARICEFGERVLWYAPRKIRPHLMLGGAMEPSWGVRPTAIRIMLVWPMGPLSLHEPLCDWYHLCVGVLTSLGQSLGCRWISRQGIMMSSKRLRTHINMHLPMNPLTPRALMLQVGA